MHSHKVNVNYLQPRRPPAHWMSKSGAVPNAMLIEARIYDNFGVVAPVWQRQRQADTQYAWSSRRSILGYSSQAKVPLLFQEPLREVFEALNPARKPIIHTQNPNF
jgi:hypothetical protein